MTNYREHRLGQESVFTVPERYSDLRPIGNGAHGTVCSAEDRITGGKVAIKKLLAPFDSPSSAQRVYRELSFMKHCQHPNIIRIFDVFIPEGTQEGMRNIYIVMEHMEFTLREVNSHELTRDQMSYLTYQLACGLKFLQHLGIWHRDLKPANVGVNNELTVKILDFGLARTDFSLNAVPRLTYYVVTRYYRAPEVILGLNYNEKVDIWSLGCILGEMLLKTILFKGDDEMDQWHKITRKLGAPPPEMLQRCSTNIREFIEREAMRRGTRQVTIFGDIVAIENSDPNDTCSYEQAASCLFEMLQIDPTARIDVNTLIEHPFLKKFRWPPGEIMPHGTIMDRVREFQRAFDQPGWGLDQWREVIFSLITATWHSSQPPGTPELETDTGLDSPPRQAPNPLDCAEYKYTLSSQLTLWSPVLGLAAYKFLRTFYPTCSPRQHVLCGTITFLTALATARLLK